MSNIKQISNEQTKATNALVHAFFQKRYPKVAATFSSEAPLCLSSKKRLYASHSLEALLPTTALRFNTKEESSHKGTKAPIPDSSSDEDEEPVKKPVAGKAALTPAKKAPIPDSSSDENEEPVRKPVAGKAALTPAKKAPIPDSSSDEDEEPVRKAVGRKTKREETESEEDGNREAAKVQRVEEQAGVAEGFAKRKGKDRAPREEGFRHFQRIDPTKVVFTAEELKDNRPGKEHLNIRQNQDMMRVKGKQFNKLKQKNKGKFYGAGVDTSVRSYQFPDSDSD